MKEPLTRTSSRKQFYTYWFEVYLFIRIASAMPVTAGSETTRAGIAPALVGHVEKNSQQNPKTSLLYKAVMSPETTRKRRVKDPVCSFLKTLISPYGCGWEKPGGVDRYANDDLIERYNKNGFMGSPSNGDMYAHFAGQTTFYFWADGRKGTPRTLTLVDIDCHRRGNARSARAFAEWLDRNGFPDLYHEPSTHGTGRHGYVILDKEGFGDVAVANILKRLEKVLKRLLQVFLATHPEHDIEDVEIKGTPHILTWAKGSSRRIESMKSGQLAKLPRDILDRFDEFRDTTVLSIGDIQELEDRVERIEVPAPRRLSASRAKGSTRNHPLSTDEVEAIGGPYLEFAGTWVPEPLATSSRAKVEAGDVAIGLAIVKVCSSKSNSDGTLPTARVKAIWDRLFQDGEVETGVRLPPVEDDPGLDRGPGRPGDGGSEVLHRVRGCRRSGDQGTGCEVAHGGMAGGDARRTRRLRAEG